MIDTVYANAIASSYEGRLLSSERISRLVECNDEDELLRLVVESGFGVGALTVDEAIDMEWANITSFVREYSPSRDISTYLLVRYDYLTLEKLVKEKYARTTFSTPILEGLYPKKVLSLAVESGDYSALDKPMADTLRRVDELFLNGAKGYEISLAFVRGLYSHLLTIKTPYLRKAVKYEISLKNITTALRSSGQFIDMYIDGGDIPYSTLEDIRNGMNDSIVYDHKDTAYGDIMRSAYRCSLDGVPYVEIERMMDSRLLYVLRENRLLPRGAEPYTLYCLYKINEIRNVRIILTGLRANQDKSNIRARLREGYEG